MPGSSLWSKSNVGRLESTTPGHQSHFYSMPPRGSIGLAQNTGRLIFSEVEEVSSVAVQDIVYGESAALSTDLMASAPPPQSRIQRLSLLLPSIVTSEARDGKKPQIFLRKLTPSES
ncbi:uncharacterized protein RAG0_04120 [Rhynchosporium agropyri]|uniref:Uncharacterized protein n=1 Tax=Rhynchosporium agropyri TaxID=914238 RepID=A0A1E1K7M9_9HELO|nr:uncharacterized protein RAG0_04120 [Rhynchosporium agropyri]